MNQIEQPDLSNVEMKMPTQYRSTGEDGDNISEVSHHQGLIIGLLVGALILVAVGLFFWYQASQVPPAPLPTPIRPTAEMNNEPESTTAEAQVESFGAMSTSNEIEAIEADLESTNLDSLESELLQIETELQASM